MDLTNLTSAEVYYLLMTDQVDISDVKITDDQLLDMELTAMVVVATQMAGGEHMVHWEASESYH